jgi:hypothetical protein
MKWTGRFKTGGLFGRKLFVEVGPIIYPGRRYSDTIDAGTQYQEITPEILQAMSEQMAMLKAKVASYELNEIKQRKMQDDVAEVTEILSRHRSSVSQLDIDFISQKLKEGYACGGFLSKAPFALMGEPTGILHREPQPRPPKE